VHDRALVEQRAVAEPADGQPDADPPDRGVERQTDGTSDDAESLAVAEHEDLHGARSVGRGRVEVPVRRRLLFPAVAGAPARYAIAARNGERRARAVAAEQLEHGAGGAGHARIVGAPPLRYAERGVARYELEDFPPAGRAPQHEPVRVER